MNLPYREGVGMMLVNCSKQVFVGKRIDRTSEAWQMPQGGMDEKETPLIAANRELKEEIGTNNATVIAESQDWYYYDLPDYLVPKIWGGKYRGQRQKWFIMRFDGSDDEINLNTQEPEFCEWKWVKPQTLPDIIVPFKRQLYEELVAEFSPYLGIGNIK